jgi:hypothetical protein
MTPELVCLVWLSVFPDRDILSAFSKQLVVYISLLLEVIVKQLDVVYIPCGVT